MRKIKTFFKENTLKSLLCLGLILLLGGGGICLPAILSQHNSNKDKDNALTNNYGNATVIGEIWKDANNYFDETNLNKLLSAISKGNADCDDLSYLESAAIAKKTAEDMRTNNGGKEIVVTMGGLDWTPTYLSTDTQGNIILTLWMSRNEQDAFEGLSENAGMYYGFVKGEETGKTGLYSDWSADYVESETAYPYPSAMYGTSYIRAVTLNNGGEYAKSRSALETVGQDSSSVFAKFTMSRVSKLANYIVAPKDVEWQYFQSATAQHSLSYLLPNEGYQTNQSDTGYYSSGRYNYSTKAKYDTWKDDKLWLPSLTETGYDDTHIGIWNTSTEQRKNYDGSTLDFLSVSHIGGEENTNYATYVYASSWLRSGEHSSADIADSLMTSAYNYDFAYVNFSQAVRPALHLNLNSAVNSIPKTTWLDFAASNFAGGFGTSSSPYKIANAEQLALLAKRVNTENAKWASKSYIQTADIDISAHEWVPIANSGSPFTGSFDGRGHKIDGMTITLGERDYCGLFGYSVGATIENVILNSGTINVSNVYVCGSILGGAGLNNTVGTTVSNCISKVNMNVSGGWAGGIVGDLYMECGVSDCYYSGTLVGDFEYIGGIVANGSYCNIHNCFFEGSVTGSGDNENLYVGGILGYSELGAVKIHGCVSNGYIKASGNNCVVGSLGGNVSNSTITSCAAYKDLICYSNSGALIGVFSSGTITGCSFKGTCNEDLDMFGKIGNVTISACYAWINDKKIYSNDNKNWTNYYGLVAGNNDNLPMQKAIYHIAVGSPYTSAQIIQRLKDFGFDAVTF